MRRAWFISRHGIMYQVGIASIYAASISTFVQSMVIFLEVPEAVVTIYLPCPLFALSNTLSLVPFICTLNILPAWFITRQSWGR